MRTIPIALLAAMLLSACATNYSETLEQKLSDKTPEQKRVILAQECREEIEAGLKSKDEANVRHFERMRKICEEMTGKPISITAPAAPK